MPAVTNESPPPENAAISAILWTPDRYQTIRRTVQSLRAQTARDRVELVLLAPELEGLEGADEDVEGFAGHQLLAFGAAGRSQQIRCMGVRAARAPVVAFMQDHSFPEPRWAQALIEAYQAPCRPAGVGFVFRNANPKTATSWVNFLLQYGDWTEPLPPGPPRHIGGHNVSYRRDMLLELEDLASALDHASLMQWQLMRKGHRFTVTPEAAQRHLNHSRLWPSALLRFATGRVFGAKRTGQWPAWRRGAYAAAWPLIAAVRQARLSRAALRTGQGSRLPRVLAVGALLLTIDAIGQAAGSLSGAGRAMEYITSVEYQRERFMHPDEIAAAVAER